tara:strand:+ start:229 stop:609 length:381 start_codon:yes stop_codon:yes gene_type:complete
MRYEMIHEYQLNICIDEIICEPFIIDFPSNFNLKELLIDSQNDPLIPLCECEVYLDDILIYEGSIGDSIEINIDSEVLSSKLTINTKCDALKKLIDNLPTFKVSIVGEYSNFGEPNFSQNLQETWC